MHLAEVGLIEFYQKHKQSLRDKGFSILLLALVRDADAPNFYEDVDRYWSSLDNVTGPHILFAVASPNASERANVSQVLSDFSYKYLTTPNIAVPEKTVEVPTRSMENDRVDYYLNMSGRAKARQSPNLDIRQFANSNSAQVRQLASHLGLSEADLPCLHLTLLVGSRQRTTALPLRGAPELSVYVLCKQIMESFGSLFDDRFAALSMDELQFRAEGTTIAEIDAQIKALRNQFDGQLPSANDKKALEFNATVDDLRVMTVSGRFGAETETADRIIETCLLNDFSGMHKRQCFDAFSVLRAQCNLSAPERALFQKLISMATNGVATEASGDSLERKYAAARALKGRIDLLANQRILHTETQEEIRRRRIKLASAVEENISEAFMKTPGAIHSIRVEPWDFFISYASHDRDIATQVFLALKDVGRSFMDHFCLSPGELWQKSIPTIQSNCKATVAIITKKTSEAHFQISEIQRAINMTRSSSHKILPVYIAPRADTPFGLEQFHSLYGETVRGAIDQLILAIANDRQHS